MLLLSSEDEDEDEDEEEEEEYSLEPNITKMETKEALKKHTDKLCCMVYICLYMDTQ